MVVVYLAQKPIAILKAPMLMLAGLPFVGLWLFDGTYWVLVKGFNLSYHNKKTAFFTIGPYYGN